MPKVCSTGGMPVLVAPPGWRLFQSATARRDGSPHRVKRRERRFPEGRDKRGLSRGGAAGVRALPSGRFPYAGIAFSLHGESRLPTWRVWVSYVEKRRFLCGTLQIAIMK